MQITVSDETGEHFAAIEVDGSTSLDDLKAIIEAELNVPMAQQVLLVDGKPLSAPSALKDNDMILVRKYAPPPPAAAAGAPAAAGGNPHMLQAQQFIDEVLATPGALANLKFNQPALGEAIERRDLQAVVRIITEAEKRKREAQLRRLEKMRQLEEDPFNVELQQEIEKEIQQENIQENMELAIEEVPEAFGSVVMLYVDAKINGHPIKAFVDSGAQSTIISMNVAERCGIMRLVDKRFSGIARGVGTGKIVGRVHVAQLQLGSAFYPCTFTVMENQDMEFLLGLDMLRRHQMAIDLRENVLRVGSEAVPFLSEKDIPRHLLGHEAEASSSANSAPSAPTSPSSARHPAPALAPASSAPAPALAGPAPAAPPAAAPPAGRGGAVSEEKIEQIVALGFDRQQAAAALAACGGNVELAAAMLFQR
eukprot:tig00021254_g19686.t1